MDFVTKKVFESKLKNVGRDLGLSSNNASSSNTQPPWAFFTRDDDIAPDPESGRAGESSATQFPSAAAAYFDAQPNNYPPFLRLFFVDRSIIAHASASAVAWAFRTAHLAVLLLVINLSVNILVVALRKGNREWHLLLIAAPVALLFTGFQLVAADTAFRGVYRSASALRSRYCILGAASLGLMIPYAFVGTAFFNGWVRIATVGNDEAITSAGVRALRRALAVAEAAGWTVAMFLQTYAMFEMYSVWKGRLPGLSDEALAAARGIAPSARTAAQSGASASESTPPPSQRGDGRDQETRERIEYIKQKYGGQSGAPRM